MRDRFIRAAFHQKILKKAHNCESTLVIDELGLKNGSIRADIAVLNGKMIGYEIKTDNDTLSRLYDQMTAYNEVFDQVWVIVGEKHLNKIVDMVPGWWGIYLIREKKTRGDYYFRRIRKAKKNKNQNCYGIAQLLWKDEARNILALSETHFKTQITRQELYHLLSENYSVKKLGQFALEYLKCREGWRINQKALL